MIEADALLAMFTLQILAMSVVYPAWFVRYWRQQATRIPADRLAQIYPEVDLGLAQQRFLTRYYALNTGITVLGLLLLGWLFSYMREPDWHDGPVQVLIVVYFLVQWVLPVGIVARLGRTIAQLDKRSLLDGKRKAILRRRGLFDFVSPFSVFLAALSYLLFVAFVIYIQQRPFAGFAGTVNIGAITLVYAAQAFVIYAVIYGRKFNPFETQAGHARTIGLVVKCCVYSCIACVGYLSLNFTLALLQLHRWEPFALSAFLVVSAFLSLMGMAMPQRPPETGGRPAAG